MNIWTELENDVLQFHPLANQPTNTMVLLLFFCHKQQDSVCGQQFSGQEDKSTPFCPIDFFFLFAWLEQIKWCNMAFCYKTKWEIPPRHICWFVEAVYMRMEWNLPWTEHKNSIQAGYFFFIMLGPERLKHKFSKTLSDLDNCSAVTEEFLIKPKSWGRRRGSERDTWLFISRAVILNDIYSSCFPPQIQHFTLLFWLKQSENL